MTTALPSAALDPATLDAAKDELVATLRDLIRIPSINPPPDDAPDGELRAAGWIGDALEDAGIPAEIHVPVPGRGSVTARLRGDGTGGEPLLLMSHLDVVPAPPDEWTHDPFAGDLADGYVWGRGAVDMKHLVAMELVVMRMLAAEARAAGRDPASDPVPGLTPRHPLRLDRRRGGGRPQRHRPARPGPAGAAPGRRRDQRIGRGRDHVRRPPVLPDRRRGEGLRRVPDHGPRDAGPRVDAARRQRGRARVADRDAPRGSRAAAPDAGDGALPGRRGGDARRGPAPPRRALSPAPTRAPAELALEAACDPFSARVLRALLRDSVSPNIIHAGVKYNVIPGEATIEVDCRVLPGTSEDDMRRTLVERIGPDLAAVSDVELVVHAPPVEAPTSGRLYDTMVDTLRDHDPDGTPVPIIVPYATDAKHTAALGVLAYGFSPLRLAPREPFLELWHGVDERVGVDALRWGLPVLYDVVRRFCA